MWNKSSEKLPSKGISENDSGPSYLVMHKNYANMKFDQELAYFAFWDVSKQAWQTNCWQEGNYETWEAQDVFCWMEIPRLPD